MHSLNLNHSKGFSILAVILVIVVVVVSIGVWALSGQSNAQNNSNTNIDIQATTIINDSAAIKSAYDNLIINGISPNNITYVPNITPALPLKNMLDPVNGISAPNPNVASLRAGNPLPDPDGFWILHKFLVRRVMGVERFNTAIVLGGIKDNVCKRINYNLYGNANIDNVNYTSSSILTGLLAMTPTRSNPIASGFSSTLNMTIATGMAGCVGKTDTPDNNLYFQILKAQ